MFEEDAAVFQAGSLGCQNIIALFDGEDIRADNAGVAHPTKGNHRDQGREQTSAQDWRQHSGKNQRHHDVRQGHKDISDAHDDVIHRAAVVSSDGTKDNTNQHRGKHHNEAGFEGRARSPDDAVEDIVLALGCAQQVFPFFIARHSFVPEGNFRYVSLPGGAGGFGFAHKAVARHFVRVIPNRRRDDRREDGDENENENQNHPDD